MRDLRWETQREVPVLLHEEITHSIIGSCFDVHRELGCGFREYIYVRALERDLIRKGHRVEREVWITVYFRGEPLAEERMDMLVDGKVLVETKAGARLDPEVHDQTFSYLMGTDIELALIVHFGRQAKVHRVLAENRLKTRNGR
jgi:GxxExxY protein